MTPRDGEGVGDCLRRTAANPVAAAVRDAELRARRLPEDPSPEARDRYRNDSRQLELLRALVWQRGLESEQLAEARRLPVWVAWYEDRFGWAEDRDPPAPVDAFLTEAEASGFIEARGGPPDLEAGEFAGHTGPTEHLLLDAVERGLVRTGRAEALLAEHAARRGGGTGHERGPYRPSSISKETVGEVITAIRAAALARLGERLARESGEILARLEAASGTLEALPIDLIETNTVILTYERGRMGVSTGLLNVVHGRIVEAGRPRGEWQTLSASALAMLVAAELVRGLEVDGGLAEALRVLEHASLPSHGDLDDDAVRSAVTALDPPTGHESLDAILRELIHALHL